MSDPPDVVDACCESTTGLIDIQWDVVVYAAYAVLSGMRLDAAARLRPRPIPEDSYWGDVLNDAVLTLLDPLGRSYPATTSERGDRTKKAASAKYGSDPHSVLREFGALPLHLQIEKLARMAKTRRDNQRLALRRRLKTARDNYSSIVQEWPQITASDLVDDIINRDQQKQVIKVMCERLAPPDGRLLLVIICEGMPNEARAAKLGIATKAEMHNALRRIRSAAKFALREFQEIDDAQ
ncbi:MAG: hypothetical protein SFW65_04875 [Alphaproteobacteria bacterium]|nr:hypothetical protein [Alphaproteobacteria bacterium]